MLWEQTDAAAALRTRFAIAEATSAVSLIADALMEHWGLRVTTCERLVLSDRNLLAWVRTSTGLLVVEACGWQPMFDHLGAVAEIVAQLGALGLPVAAPRRTLSGTARALTEGGAALSVVVLPQTPGDHVDVHDRVAVHATGQLLARVHLALVQLPVPPQLGAPEAAVGIDPRSLLAAAAAGARAPRAADRLDGLLADLPDLDVAPSLVHGDVRGANVLVDARKVTALLDWDNLRVGHRVHDLAAGAVKLATRFAAGTRLLLVRASTSWPATARCPG